MAELPKDEPEVCSAIFIFEWDLPDNTEEQLAFDLKQAEKGTSVREVIWKMGISEQSFSN